MAPRVSAANWVTEPGRSRKRLGRTARTVTYWRLSKDLSRETTVGGRDQQQELSSHDQSSLRCGPLRVRALDVSSALALVCSAAASADGEGEAAGLGAPDGVFAGVVLTDAAARDGSEPVGGQRAPSSTDLGQHAFERAVVEPDKPFFVYFAPGATHTPHHVPKEWAENYAGRSAAPLGLGNTAP